MEQCDVLMPRTIPDLWCYEWSSRPWGLAGLGVRNGAVDTGVLQHARQTLYNRNECTCEHHLSEL